jgi:hypothetical protein
MIAAGRRVCGADGAAWQMGAVAGTDWMAGLAAAAAAWREAAKTRQPREGFGPDAYPAEALAGKMVGDVLSKRMWLDMRCDGGGGWLRQIVWCRRSAAVAALHYAVTWRLDLTP